MKKILVILLLIVYATTSIGATIHMHYCMGKLMGSSLVHKNEKVSKCDNCGMTGKKGRCCKDEHKYFKLKTDHKHSEKFQNNFVFDTPSITLHSFNQDYSLQDITVSFPVSNAPPPHYGRSLHIFYCTFRI